MQLSFGEKFKLIRNSLNLSQMKFSDLVDINISSYKKYEGGFTEVGSAALQKVATHPECLKYALWLLTDETNVAAGQVAPGDPSPDEFAKQVQLSTEEYEKAFKLQVEETIFMLCSMEWFKMAPDVKLTDCSTIMLNKLQPIIDQREHTNEKTSVQKMA